MRKSLLLLFLLLIPACWGQTFSAGSGVLTVSPNAHCPLNLSSVASGDTVILAVTENTTGPTYTPTDNNGTLISRSGWTATASDTTFGAASQAIDSNDATYWAASGDNNYISIDMGSSHTFNYVQWRTRADNNNGIPTKVELYVSDDGSSWGSAVETIDNLPHAATYPVGYQFLGFMQVWRLSTSYSHRYFRLKVIVSTSGFPTMAELYAGNGTQNTFTNITTVVDGTSSTKTEVWLIVPNASVSPYAIDILEPSGTKYACAIEQWTGGFTFQDREAQVGTNGTSLVSGTTATTRVATELAVGVFGIVSTTSTFTAGTGYTLRTATTQTGLAGNIIVESKNLSSTGTQQATLTGTDGSENGVGIVVTLSSTNPGSNPVKHKVAQ